MCAFFSGQRRFLSITLAGILVLFGCSKKNAGEKPVPTPGPMLSDGLIDLETPDFKFSLVRSSQTIAALRPKSDTNFDFTPGDLLVQRSQNKFNHLGDLEVRLRASAAEAWQDYSTATARMPVTALPSTAGALASADLAPTLPADIPLQVTRSWRLEDGKLVLDFRLKNKSAQPVEIGSLGIPMVFNNVLNDRSLEDAHAKCSFFDPYIGENAGYLQVTRLSGHGPALVVVPDGQTPFEAYNPILDKSGSWGAKPVFTDPTQRGITFEGFYEWMVHSRAYAENEWKNAQPWNPPTSLTLAPGQSKTYGVKFLLSDSIRSIEKTLTQNNRPVAVGVPGYVIPTDIDAKLFLQYPKKVKSMTVEPRDALAFSNARSLSKGWQAYSVKSKGWGRARLTITYEDGLAQTIQYFVTKPESQVVADMGHFLTTKQWYTDASDPFHRAPSPMTYDRETNSIVTQDSRVWIAGLGDEGGGGAWISAMMKEFVQPNKGEIEKLQQFVDGVLWGGLQFKEGPRQFGVRKSLFYHQPDQTPAGTYRGDLDWSSWTSWNKQDSERVDRSYDYPHVAAAYWALYHLARNNQNLVTNHPWDWYLDHAYQTSMAMTNFAGDYAVFGQMEGSVFPQILDDLRREGMKDQADKFEAKMRARADRWRKEAYPFGSEMPWDSTGQEEVYAWTKYFGDNEKADVTLNAILGYDPAIPHWGYNGSARRYWDFIFAAKDRRLERQLHHYGSGLNAIPLLAQYREHPEDTYLLRVGYGGTMGALTDIDQEGFASAAFHSFPDMLKLDPITGDYGPNFFGHAWNTATYVVKHPELGWLVFGGNVMVQGKTIKVTPLDSYRSRIYLAQLGLWLTLDAGTFQSVEINSASGEVRLGFAAGNRYTSNARLRIAQPAKISGVGNYRPSKELTIEREDYVVPLSPSMTWVSLAAK
jgi:hypothetical protein